MWSMERNVTAMLNEVRFLPTQNFETTVMMNIIDRQLFNFSLSTRGQETDLLDASSSNLVLRSPFHQLVKFFGL